ncbi:MAG: lamin tail domain-containing protein [Bacteroidia bacterium]
MSAQVRINEWLAQNNQGITDPQGQNDDWIELYNAGASPVDIAGYYFTDDKTDPLKWQIPTGSPAQTTIPAGGYLILWADNDVTDGPLHLDFTLNGGGEFLGMYEVIATVPTPIDSFTYGNQKDDISYGRYGWAGDFYYFEPPTPGAANGNLKIYPPDFSQKRGFYTADFLMTFQPEQVGGTIYYTLDGSEPDPANIGGKNYSAEINGTRINKQIETFVYSAPFMVRNRSTDPNDISTITPATTWWNPPSGNIFKGTIVRAKAYYNGVESDIKTHSYLIDPNIATRYSLPVLSIAVNNDSMFDYNYGIYVPGAGNASGGVGNSNFRQSWERTAHVELFEADGSASLNQNCGVKIHGNISRNYGRKSIRLYARQEYDDKNEFSYDFFPTLNKRDGSATRVDQFKRLIIRNSGNNWADNLYQDALVQHATASMGMETQASRAVLHFVNGEFWGIMNVRERQDWRYLDTHFGLDELEIAIADKLGIIHGDVGDIQHYTDIRNYVRNNDMTLAIHWDHLNTQVDIQNMINFYVTHIYTGNTDFIQNNHRRWRKKVAYNPNAPFGHDGRWRYFMFDIDHSFKIANVNADKLNTVLTDGSTHARFFQNVYANPTFKRMLINSFADHMNTSFDSVFVRMLIDSMNAEMAPHLAEHQVRWGQNNYAINDKSDLLPFIQARTAVQQQHILTTFTMATGKSDLSLDVSSTAAGNIKINTVFVDEETPGVIGAAYPWAGTYFTGVPVTLHAIPKAGYRFVRWQGLINSTVDSIDYTPAGNGTITAIFAPEPSITSLKINEFMSDNDAVVTDPQGQYEDYIEIYNSANRAINIGGLFITDDLTNPGKWQIPTTSPASTEVPAGGFLLLWADNDPADGPTHLGFKLGKNGEDIGLFQLVNGSYLSLDQLSYAAQSTDQSTGRCVDGSPYFYNFTGANTTPGTSNSGSCPILPTPNIVSLHINEIQSDNTLTIADPQGEFDDWIELYNSGTTPIDIAGLYVTDNPVDPFKWQIPSTNAAQTTIAASGFMLLWADNDILDGPTHLNFSLSKAGEYVGVFANMGGVPVPLTEFTFGPQLTDESHGSFPDGSLNHVIFTDPTPDSTNVRSVLGVDFFKVDLVRAGDIAQLSWEVGSESQTSHYIVQRAIDDGNGLQFEPLAQFDAGKMTYTFDDPLHQLSGKLAYQILGVDHDGLISRSEIKYLRLNTGDLLVYPNPSTGIVGLRIPSSVSQADILITNTQGKVVWKSVVPSPLPNEAVEIDLRELASGVYFIQVQDGNQRFTSKLMLVE